MISANFSFNLILQIKKMALVNQAMKSKFVKYKMLLN